MASSHPEIFRPLRRVEYDKLVEAGVFQGERLELLDGVLVPMSPIGPSHSSAVQKLNALLVRALLDRAAVRIQSPFAALEISEPEPDVAVVPSGDYDTAHPDRADLIIEVAESSLPLDRGRKQRLYASCGVPEYWIVNLIERQIEVYTEPATNSYGKRECYAHGETAHPLRFQDISVPVAHLMK